MMGRCLTKIYCYLMLICFTHGSLRNRFQLWACINLNQVLSTREFLRSSSLLNCAVKCRDNCAAFMTYMDNGSRQCTTVEHSDWLFPWPSLEDCTDVTKNVKVYIKKNDLTVGITHTAVLTSY